MVKCVVCKRERQTLSEGRRIDGSWAEDERIPKRYWDKWVCCWNCYSKLLFKKTKKEN